MKNIIELLRKENGVLQETLAKAIGVSRQTVVGIESGKCTPPVNVALRIARFFNLSVDEIFFLEEGEGWVSSNPDNVNYKKNSALPVSEGLINGQNAVSDFSYGKFSLSFNGGEIVAVYNALLLSGERRELSDMILEFEENKLYMLGSFGGTDPKKIGIYLAVHKIPSVTVTSERDLRDKLLADEPRPFIFSYFDIKGPLELRVIHTVAGIRVGDGFELYNISKDGTAPVLYDSYLHMKKGKKLIVAYIIT